MPIKTLLILTFGFSTVTLCRAQGIIPSLATAPVAESTAPVTTLLIGQRVPETAVVLNEENRARTLLSYKAPLEVLVVYVFSGTCEAEEKALTRYRQLYERFKEWRVAFVEIRIGRPATDSPWPIPRVTDPTGRTHRLLGVRGTPMILILDEMGTLRYRGTLDEGPLHKTSARRALEDVIGHVEPVKDPEPEAVLLCPWP